MILEIVNYGHPVLRQPGTKIDAFTPDIAALAANMIETMHEAHGVGLAAQQVARALQLFVIDVREVTDRPSTLELNGQTVEPADHMPMVLVNPQITPLNDPVTGPEGCLSFPEIYADIARPESVEVEAQNDRGHPVKFRCGGLLSKAIQHEHDHLLGILFIDRMDQETKDEIRPMLEEIQGETKAKLKLRRSG